MRRVFLAFAAVLFLVPWTPANSQTQPRADAFRDEAAFKLYAAAAARWNTLDESILSYTAKMEQRISASLRTPLRDRSIYRNEMAARAFWRRGADPIVQLLGSRTSYPGRDLAIADGNLDWLEDLPFDRPFEPGADQLFYGFRTQDEWGMDDDGINFKHPLAKGSDREYHFRSGDTLRLFLPDERTLEVVALDVIPRESQVDRISGTLWIEPESGALVRAVFRLSRRIDVVQDIPWVQQEDEEGAFRLVPGFLKPWTVELSLFAVDYSLWDFEVWLPRSMRVEGQIAAGVLKAPVAWDISYAMEDVVIAEDLQEAPEQGPRADAEAALTDSLTRVHFDTRAEAMDFIAGLLGEGDRATYAQVSASRAPGRDLVVLAPEEREDLEESPYIPAPIWEDAPGFASEDDLRDYTRILANLPLREVEEARWRFSWGPQGSGLLRYNRVEGPAAGAQIEGEVSGGLRLKAQGFFGFADLRPKARVEVERFGVLRRIALGAYSELKPAEPHSSHFGLGNSFAALLGGRDDGEYYRATGLDLTWRPPDAERESFVFRLYGERQAPVSTNTNFALFEVFTDNWTFRPNLAAAPVDEAGASLRLRSWWGRDPRQAQFGLETRGHAALWRGTESGDAPVQRYARASAVARMAIPLSEPSWDGWRLGSELAFGTTFGPAPLQTGSYHHAVATTTGSGTKIIGLTGPSFLRGRIEIGRAYHGVTAAALADAAWAGRRDAFDIRDALGRVGLGLSILDGLLRIEPTYGLLNGNGSNSFRLDLYFDSIL